MGKPRNPNVSQILAAVHQSMLSRFSPSGQMATDIEKAKTLTDFLQKLKLRASGATSSDLGSDLFDMVLDNIRLPNGRTLHKLFRRVGSSNKDTGQKFEDDLAAAIAAVVNLAQPGQQRVTYKNFSFGTKAGSTGMNLGAEIEESANELAQELAEQTAEQIKKESSTKAVMGKIDTIVNQNIVNLNASVDIPENLLSALSHATFTDKSYRSIGWDKTQNKTIDLGNRVIHLGNSSPYRAVLGSMTALGFSASDTSYIYYAGRNILAGKDSTPPPESPDHVKQHIYHLRYMYELTGAGIIYKDFSGIANEGAKFLVYNDPNSDEIICVSTAQIISQLLQSSDFPDNPYGSIGIAKAAVRSFNKN